MWYHKVFHIITLQPCDKNLLFVQSYLESTISKCTCLCFNFGNFSGKNNWKEIIDCESLSWALASGQSSVVILVCLWTLELNMVPQYMFVHLFLVSITNALRNDLNYILNFFKECVCVSCSILRFVPWEDQRTIWRSFFNKRIWDSRVFPTGGMRGESPPTS